MNLKPARTIRTALCIGGIAVLTAGLSACWAAAATGGTGFSQTVKGENGSESSVRFGADAVLPANFPAASPAERRCAAFDRRREEPAQRVVHDDLRPRRPGRQRGRQPVPPAAREGRVTRSSTSAPIGGTDSQITQFDAVGKKWDVAVVSGKASPRDRATLSVQVHTHGQLTSGIGGIGDTTPDITAPAGSGHRDPEHRPNSHHHHDLRVLSCGVSSLRPFASAATILLVGGILAGCGSDGSDAGDQARGEEGRQGGHRQGR